MLDLLARSWWILVLRGLLAVAFGALAILAPGITLATLVLFFGAFALVNGTLAVIAAIGGRRQNPHWWVVLLEGGLGIAVGLVTLRSPALTALALLLYIAAWAIVTGALEVLAAIRLRKEIEGELWLALSGLLSIGFGGVLLAAPGTGALAMLWVIAAYAIVLGVALVLLGLRVRRALPARA